MRWGRAYFAAQAAAGALWWVAVFVSPLVHELTLGGLDPVLVAVVDVPLFVGASAAAALGSSPAAVITTGWTLLVTTTLAAYATVTTEAGWGVLLMAAASGGSLAALCLMRFGRVPTEWIIFGPFRFRPAVPGARPGRRIAATAVQITVFWGLFLVVAPLALLALEMRWGVHAPAPAYVRLAGAGVLVLASALGLWAAGAMSTRGDGTPLPSAMPNRLVIAGPYRYVRNPMAVSGILQGVAVGVILSSWLVVMYALIGSLVWNFMVRPHEEANLAHRFGDAFERYRAEVRCWVPRVGRRAGAPAASPAGTG
ncbi:isoprenylcysteine carboxylmethyltransferase family protein [Agromyces sp. G08B096]|uniref:Isoprenylcysteine carboxylmethyltransferase family protein n=1 Tax=Agromyces sp. G08B096 TaxID=3156399 RepID=A0AAU7WAS0_9MICO